MRVFSRGLFVGFLLVMAVVASGCQPVQPGGEDSAVATSTVMLESEPVTDTAVLSATVAVSATTTVSESATVAPDSAAVSETVAISEAVEISETVPAQTPAAVPLQEEAERVDPALVESGLLIYRAQYCGVCHTLDAAETRGVFGPPHNDMHAVAQSYLSSGQYSGAATTPAE